MIFRIGEKFYIKVQGYYKEVDISIEGNNLAIKPNGNEIEVSNVKNVQSYNTQYEVEDIKKYIKTEKKNVETQPERRRDIEREYKPRRNRETNRM